MKNDEHKEFQARISNLFIEHDEVTRIWRRLDKNRRNKRAGTESAESPIHIFIEGKPGAGKSMTLKKYVKKNKGWTVVDEDDTETDIKPVIYMTLPIPFTYKGFYNNILKAMELPARNADVDRIKTQAFEMMKALKVEMLIIDELDYLLASTFVQRKAVMENIKDIANSADVCLVCVGTLAIEELRTLNTQHIRRYPKTVLRHFENCDDAFKAFIKNIEVQLSPPPGLLDWTQDGSVFPEFLYEVTGGLVGWIKPILREAFDIIGVMEEDFNDFNVLKNLDGDVIVEAQKNIIGEFADNDMAKILADELVSEEESTG
ncbi:TniB family NTP-binding protein [Paenibacillus sp. CGMCC 1.16610]|uniref:AAA family ATPase n=1 Tax=Paenibacillus anseongense TaxID=2682845 RepID=A0ABW9UJN7_9BACL|nr:MULTISPECIES: TniB family NTP-binding protein [Paenibacillus]MBA2939864.1 TniB family NTP-binding protein [Paenibacillus sp. CGMCC 1.16610]MVQ39524.1 AAA family ATPase [Paenibacillus anseongense]